LTALRQDDWLSERLGKPAFSAGAGLTAADLPAAPAFVGAKVDVGDTAGLLRLQALGFKLLDTNVQLAREAAPLPVEAGPARFAQAQDEAGIRAIAAEAFVYDRFHRDPAIGGVAASWIKADWAGNFFAGKRGDWMVTAGAPGKPEGFLQLLRGDDGAVVIDLVAVSSGSRGRGLAQAMIAFAAEACLGRATTMRVGTQLANLPSLALYQGLGFRVTGASHVCHLHI